MRLPAVLTSLLALSGLAAVVVYATATAPQGGPRTPVLVELFTSEGCSSCPPADALLSTLVAEQPVDGVEVVGLSLHVDYWNRLGWTDPFSSKAFTDRQNDYATIWGVSRIYTPQAVVDGAREFIGSDWAAARQFVQAAAAVPKAAIALRIDPRAPGSDRVSAQIVVDPSPARASDVHLLLAVAEDGLVSEVRRGENANRRLSHARVVRSLRRLTSFEADSGVKTSATIHLNPAWRPDRLRLVVFAQDPVSRAVVGVASRTLKG